MIPDSSVSREAAMASCGTWMKSSSYDPDGNNSHPSLWEFGVLQAEQDSWSYTPALQIPKLPQAKEEIQRNVVLTARKKRGIILFSKGSAPELEAPPRFPEIQVVLLFHG